MIRVPVDQFEAKSAIYLKKAEDGEEVWIERDGRLVARLVAAGSGSARSAAEPGAIPETDLMRRFREGREGLTLGSLDWKVLRDEGRR